MGIFRSVEIFLESGVACGTSAFHDAQASEHHRCGTDGSNEFPLLILAEHGIAHTLVVVEVCGAWQSSGQHQQVGILQLGVLEFEVGLHGHAVCHLY